MEKENPKYFFNDNSVKIQAFECSLAAAGKQTYWLATQCSTPGIFRHENSSHI